MPRGTTDAMVHVDGHRISLTNLDKPLYPAVGLRKADVVDYYAAVSAVMIPHLADRPVTRKRWPDGVEAQPFFEKNLGKGVPGWVRRRTQQHSGRVAEYPVVDSPATLIWLAQLAALELHVPQWYFDPRGRRSNPDRLVFDLDPGPGTTLSDCATVARSVRDMLGPHGSGLVPVTSGSKGLHLYLGLNGAMTSDEASDWAHRLARSVERSMPDRVVSKMTKSLRTGRVLIDWSQNNAAKTTIAPYSLRGRSSPTVAAPRTWDELDDPRLAQLDHVQVLDRIESMPDPMAALGRGWSGTGAAKVTAARGRAGSPQVRAAVRAAAARVGVTVGTDGSGGGDGVRAGAHDDDETAGGDEDLDDGETSGGDGDLDDGEMSGGDAALEVSGTEHGTGERNLLGTYRSRRSAGRTPEPVPQAGSPLPRGDDDTFVIQEHHARRLHWDFRLERGGVLVSWAVPKGLPTDSRQNRLAVHTEDHPLEYAGFAGTIPKAEYGGGEVTIWDAGRYRAEKWRDDELIVVLHGRRAQGRYVLVRTDGSNWLMRRMKDQAGTDPPAAEAKGRGSGGARGRRRGPGRAPFPHGLAPMLATPGSLDYLGDGPWRFEGKWDGIRAIAELDGGELRVRSRAGNDITVTYPELRELAEHPGDHSLVLDGEIVAIAENGAPSFELLQRRMGLRRPRDVRAAAAAVPAHYYIFDVLYLDGVCLLGKTYDDRRRLLVALGISTAHCVVPAQLEGSSADALAESRRRKLEGIVAKAAGSTYLPGRRSSAWLKVKLWATQDVVIVGWRPGQGRRAGGIGSLLLAMPDDGSRAGDGPGNGPRRDPGTRRAGALVYAGRVGTGFTDAMLARLHDALKPLQRKTSPVADSIPAVDARDVVWVTPKLVGEVTYSEITRDGRLRQASWRGLREDVRLGEVRRGG